MNLFIKFNLLLFSILIFQVTVLSAQVSEEPDTSATIESNRIQRAPSVFIDCSRCDYNHLREEIPYLNYVRDPEQADIHVFVTDVQTVGGRDYEFSFIGRRIFSQIAYDLEYISSNNNSEDETRKGIVDVLKAGFMPFMNQSPLSSRFQLQYDSNGIDADNQFTEQDPWNYWVFEAYFGSVSLDLESNETDFDSRWGFYADRVTEEWKFRFRPFFNYSLREIRQEEEEDIRRTINRHGIESHALKSINEHWSVGLFGSYDTRNDRNLKNQLQLSPGVEYSLLPYDLATRKAITFTYNAGFIYADYYEETIFGVQQENLFNHSLEAAINIKQPWGDISGGVEGSHYFHDAAFRRVEFFGGTSIRLAEGLFLSFDTNLQMIQDQLTLPAGDASLEDILLQQRQLATDFEFYGSISISYTFGSDFANVVNTRF